MAGELQIPEGPLLTRLWEMMEDDENRNNAKKRVERVPRKVETYLYTYVHVSSRYFVQRQVY